jgi:glycosyltransferase involved in cell wall biosynthesis
MDKDIKFSVIMPLYNVEPYVNEAIDSVLKQSYNNFELILVNDGSTDKTKEICEEYLKIDKRVILVNKENGGLSSARNAGIEAARGDYLCFIDGDDIVGEDMLLWFLKAITKFEANLIECGIVPFLETPMPQTYKFNEILLVDYANYPCDERLGSFFSDSSCNKAFNKSLFEALRFPNDRKPSEDSAIIGDIFMRESKVALVPYSGYFYRCRQGSIMQSPFKESDLYLLEILEKRIESLKEKGFLKVARQTQARLSYELLRLYLKQHNARAPKNVAKTVAKKFKTLNKTNKKNPYTTRKVKLMVKLFSFSKPLYCFIYNLWQKRTKAK